MPPRQEEKAHTVLWLVCQIAQYEEALRIFLEQCSHRVKFIHHADDPVASGLHSGEEGDQSLSTRLLDRFVHGIFIGALHAHRHRIYITQRRIGLLDKLCEKALHRVKLIHTHTENDHFLFQKRIRLPL